MTRSLPHLLALLLLATPLFAAPEDRPADPPKPPILEKSLLDKYNDGGPWMHPILLTSVAMVGFSVLCGMQIRRPALIPPALLATLRQMVAARQVTDAYRLCKSQTSPLARVMEAALLKANFEREGFNKSNMEMAAADAIVHEETRLMVWVNAINICAQIAPMLGLFGTVVGMIEAFDLLAAGRAEPTDLAGGIGVAMITTAGGLIVAIPAMAIYFFFRGRLVAIITEIQKQVGTMLDLFTGEMTPDGHRPSDHQAPETASSGQ